MSSALCTRWSCFDKFIQMLRYHQVIRYIPKNSFVVDLGCGNGHFLKSIRGKLSRGIGLDSITENKKEDNITIMRGDLNSPLMLSHCIADRVVSLAVLEHLYNPSLLIIESYRILKPGGMLLLTTPSPQAKGILEFMAFKLNIISQEDIRDHKRYFSKNDLVKLFSIFPKFHIIPFQLGLNHLVIASK